MGKYTMIADTSEQLVSLLQSKLVPNVINNANEIGLRSPEDHGDVVLGLYLYNIEPSQEMALPGKAMVRREKLTKPPVFLTLHYMITAYSQGDLQYRLSQDERILGKVIQVFHDHNMIPVHEVDEESMIDIDLHVTMERITVDEKSRIWNFPQVGNRLSLFYKVTPVSIDSDLTSDFTRVTDLDISLTLNKQVKKPGKH